MIKIKIDIIFFKKKVWKKILKMKNFYKNYIYSIMFFFENVNFNYFINGFVFVWIINGMVRKNIFIKKCMKILNVCLDLELLSDENRFILL